MLSTNIPLNLFIILKKVTFVHGSLYWLHETVTGEKVIKKAFSQNLKRFKIIFTYI